MNKKITQKFLTLLLGCFCSMAIYAGNKSVDDIAGIYTGKLTIDLSNIQNGPTTVAPDQILLEKESEDKIKLTLNNFTLGVQPIGDIIVPGITVVQTGDEYNFESNVVLVELMGGMIQADVKVTGKILNGNTDITIDVEWVAGEDRTPIPVKFSGELISDGLRLTDIRIDGISVSDFDAGKFNYTTPVLTGTEKLTYAKDGADTSVDVALDGNWLYLYVTDGVKRNRYTLYATDNDGTMAIINKITIDQNIDGNLTLSGGAEIQGNATVAKTITYNKAIGATLWNAIGLAYDLASINGVKADGTKTEINDAHWYAYNKQGEQQRLNAPEPVMVMKLKDNTADIVSLDLISEQGSGFEKDGTRNIEENTYYIIPNPTLHTITVSEFFSTMDAYYTFNGSSFEKTDASAEVQPATMYIAYKGNSPVESIAAPNPDLSGIGRQPGDDSSIYASNGQVYINNYNGIVEVHVLNGNKILAKNVNGSIELKLDNGVYIVRTGKKGTIVNVK